MYADIATRCNHYHLPAALLLALVACGRDDSADPMADHTTFVEAASTTGSTADTEITTGAPDGFGSEEEFVLRLDDGPVAPLRLNMNRAEVAELFGDAAKGILITEVETSTLLENGLDEIKTACGIAWQEDYPDPQLNCNLTELGQSFKGPGGTWESSAEFSLVRILTMTPANAQVGGTTLATLQSLADALGLGGGFGQILADALGIARTEEFITTPELVTALQRNLLATHPNIGGDGTRLRITLDDVLSDLATLTTKLGPVGSHPGVFAPGFSTKSEVLTADFALMVEADSNLRLLEGIDLSEGKGYMSTIVDHTGPSFGDPLEFDFNDPEKFQLHGVAADPRIDMRFAISEHDGFISSCTGEECKLNLPEHLDVVEVKWPDTSVWAIDPWQLEAILAVGGREKYEDRVFDNCYTLIVCVAHVFLGFDTPGWAHFELLLDLGNPPADQFVWELLSEVAQVALHNPPGGAIPEGEADVAFTLRDIPIGISGPKIAETVRPYLQGQTSKLAQLILGDFWKHNDALDFYYRRGSDMVPYLFYVGAADLPPGTPYTYESPGFYTCPELRPDCKVSSVAIAGAGDDTHEKLRLAPGETVLYLEDDVGDLFRARFIVPEHDAAAITVRIAAAR